MTGKFLRRKIKKMRKWISEQPANIKRYYAKKKIKNKDFSIISNNCWAGKAYQYLDLPYLSPTIGLYFFADDYIRFVSNLSYYLSLELHFITASDSKYAECLESKNESEVPIGVLDDVEIIFLHYASEEEAREKWERRKQRMNYNNLVIKFSNMNLCTEKEMEEFDMLPFGNKFMLNNKKTKKYKSEIVWKGNCTEREVLNDTNPFPGNLDLIKLLNVHPERYPTEGLNTNLGKGEE